MRIVGIVFASFATGHSMIRLYADFQNADRLGRVRLNCNGTIADLAALKVELFEGMRVVLDECDEIVAEGTVTWGAEEGWVAEVDWDRIDADLRSREERKQR
jgi:hypothetical protein